MPTAPSGCATASPALRSMRERTASRSLPTISIRARSALSASGCAKFCARPHARFEKDIRMKVIWMTAALFLAFFAAAAQRRADNANPLGNSEQAIRQGQEIYSHNCTVCHGLNGAAGERGPALAAGREYARRKDRAIFDAVQNGIAGTLMPASGLSPMDIWKVVAYIRSLRATASDALVPGDVAHGEQIFWGQGRCAECHTIRGRGGILGPDLSNIGG